MYIDFPLLTLDIILDKTGEPTAASTGLVVANYSNCLTGGNTTIQLISANGGTVTITADASTTTTTDTDSPTFAAVTDNNTTAANLASCINANSRFIATAASNLVSIYQVQEGTTGNTTVTVTELGSDVSILSQNFTGGTDVWTDRQAELNTVTGVLRANKTQLLMRGTLRDILNEREALLEARGFTIPEDWDLEWSYTQGPIWYPALEPSCKFHLSPEYFKEEAFNDSACADKVSEASDRTGNKHHFLNTDCGSIPPFSSHLNGHKGLDFDNNGNTALINETTTGEGEDSVQYDTAITAPPNKGLSVAVFTRTSATAFDNNNDVLFGKGNFAGFNTDWQLRNHTQNRGFIFDYGNVLNTYNSTTTPGECHMVTAGLINTTGLFIRVNGDNQDLTGQTFNAIATGKLVVGAAWDGGTTYTRDYSGDIFEVALFETYKSDELNEKFEGYCAHKYRQTHLLPADHPYKTVPPRADRTV